MSKASLETKIRNEIVEKIAELLRQEYGDALAVGPGELAIPTVDEEKNEGWALVKVSTPRGTRNGSGGYDPYDGYAAADDWAFTLEQRAAKKAATAAKAAAKEKEKERKREAKKVVKDLNTKGLDGMIHEEAE